MALVRILVDGYSLLHAWPEIAPGRARHTAAARDELINILTLYQDAAGTSLTVVFDGANNDIKLSTVESTRNVEILYTRAGQTADQVIERVAHRMRDFGEVLAVTDDNAERDTVIAMGGMASSCGNFIQTIGSALGNLQDELKHYNRKERNDFNRPR